MKALTLFSVNSLSAIRFNDIYQFKSITNNQYQPTESIFKDSYIIYSGSFQSSSLFINDVYKYLYIRNDERVDITRLTENNDDNITTEIHTQLPLFFINRNRIKVPSKIAYTLSRHMPKHLLKDIHPDVEVAIEFCLIFMTQLTSTYFEVMEKRGDGWKHLKAEYLRELLSLSSKTYDKVITALTYPLEKGQIMERILKYTKGKESRKYRIGERYIGKGIVGYDVKTKEAQGVLNRHYFRSLTTANDNPICQNLIEFYRDITLPSIDQINKEAKRLIKLGYKARKGKLLTRLNKHSRDYWKDSVPRGFVEDAVEIFSYLTDNGLMIPTIGSERSGGRVVDSITLMPSWIRRMVKIGGKTAVECDFSCLHPNIALGLYGGSHEFLTHGDLQLALGLDIDTVKVEHLSFFNKTVWQMKQSPLYGYYQENEPRMLANIIAEKYASPYKHKETSMRMFAKEVSIMADVVLQLNQEEIYVGYVYDALFCHPKHAERVKQVMDETILKHGIKTTAKLSSGKKYNPIVTRLKDTKFDLSTLKKEKSTVKPGQAKAVLEPIDFITIDAGEINFNTEIKSMILENIEKGEHPAFFDVVIRFYDGETIRDKVVLVDDPINPQLKYVTHSHIHQTALVA